MTPTSVEPDSSFAVTSSNQIPEESIIQFPEGIPGFENCKRFIILQPEGLAPLLLLHTAEGEALSLPVLPVEVVEADYKLKLAETDRKVLELTEDPVIGENVLCLAVLVLPGAKRPPTCNLMAPIVVNPVRLVAKQILQAESEYPSTYPLTME